jgi:NAD-dependent SIR2 family protein deacetylase
VALSRRFRHRRDDWLSHGQLHVMTCPVCGHTFREPAAQIGTVLVCPACGSSLHADDDGTVRPATAAETTALSAADLQTLRTARGRIARPDRRPR